MRRSSESAILWACGDWLVFQPPQRGLKMCRVPPGCPLAEGDSPIFACAGTMRSMVAKIETVPVNGYRSNGQRRSRLLPSGDGYSGLWQRDSTYATFVSRVGRPSLWAGWRGQRAANAPAAGPHPCGLPSPPTASSPGSLTAPGWMRASIGISPCRGECPRACGCCRFARRRKPKSCWKSVRICSPRRSDSLLIGVTEFFRDPPVFEALRAGSCRRWPPAPTPSRLERRLLQRRGTL